MKQQSEGLKSLGTKIYDNLLKMLKKQLKKEGKDDKSMFDKVKRVLTTFKVIKELFLVTNQN